LALAAAVVHAGWNLLLAREEDTHAATAVAVAVGAVAFAPVAIADWRMSARAVPYMAASTSLELVYLGLLATAYSLAALSFVYPIARGSAPVLVLIVSVAFLGVSVSWLAGLGVLLVAAGIVLVRGLRERPPGRDLALALGVGGCIAAYTLVDKHGIRHASPIAYLEVVFTGIAAVYVAVVFARRGGAVLRRALKPATVFTGIGFFGSYGLTLLALARAPAASVAAVREVSVLIATAVAARTLHEPVGLERMAGAALVVGGIAAIALG
jgi:drug/metabolite transporter (DMT)-like permease